MTDELKECPFCGSTYVGFAYNDRKNHFVRCFKCHCNGPRVTPLSSDPEPQAVARWNARAPNHETQDPILDHFDDPNIPYRDDPYYKLTDDQRKSIEKYFRDRGHGVHRTKLDNPKGIV